DGDERGHPAALLLDGAAVRPADRPAFQADWRWQTRMKRTNHPLLRLVLVLAAVIILMPVAVLLLWSVTGRWPWPNLLPERYTLRTVQELLFGSANLPALLWSSISLSAIVALLSTATGLLTARATELYSFRGKTLVHLGSILPLLVPGTVFAMGIQITLIRLGLSDT